jgi:hypothetical protein
MAKIFIVGRNPIEVSRDDAIRLNDMWIASRDSRSTIKNNLLPEVLEAGGQTFLSRDIKGFDFSDGFVKQGIPEYDLNDPAQKAKVKSFMAEFDDWKARHPEITEWHEYHYLEEQGVIKMGKHRSDDVIVVSDISKYQELKKLFSSRQTLLYLRERAAKHNDPNFEADRVKKFQEIKEQVFGKRETKNEALEKLTADAKAFGKAHGLDEEIDPDKIPF